MRSLAGLCLRGCKGAITAATTEGHQDRYRRARLISIVKSASWRKSVPRTRGDEPYIGTPLMGLFCVFPARAGMNRWPISLAASGSRVPRTRGDEPRMPLVCDGRLRCSPHARG